MTKISGKILDIDNEPLIGANITLRSGAKSGRIGTVSDIDGNFSLESNEFSEEDLFEVSYVGFVKQSFKAKELNDKNVILKEAITELGDVVIMGTKPKQSTNKKPKNNLELHLNKNKYVYAGLGGLLGIALLFLSIKKLK